MKRYTTFREDVYKQYELDVDNRDWPARRAERARLVKLDLEAAARGSNRPRGFFDDKKRSGLPLISLICRLITPYAVRARAYLETSSIVNMIPFLPVGIADGRYTAVPGGPQIPLPSQLPPDVSPEKFD